MPEPTYARKAFFPLHAGETTEQLVRSGLNLPDAFQRALADVGNMLKIAPAFRKLDQPLWLPVKPAIGVTGLLVLILAKVVFCSEIQPHRN